MSNIVKFEFDGDTLDVVRHEGRGYVSLRKACEVFGVDVDSQRKKLKELPWASTVIITAVAEDGKNRDLVCLDLDSFAGWLFTINPGKVKLELRDKLMSYQRRAAAALRDFFMGTPTMTEDTRKLVESMSAQIAQLSSVVLPLADHPDRFLPRAELQDYPRELGRLRQLIGNAARAQGKHWNSVHGEIVRRYQLRSYKRLPYTVWAQVSAWLTEVLSTPHKQLPAAPHPGGQRSFDWKCN